MSYKAVKGKCHNNDIDEAQDPLLASSADLAATDILMAAPRGGDAALMLARKGSPDDSPVGNAERKLRARGIDTILEGATVNRDLFGSLSHDWLQTQRLAEQKLENLRGSSAREGQTWQPTTNLVLAVDAVEVGAKSRCKGAQIFTCEEHVQLKENEKILRTDGPQAKANVAAATTPMKKVLKLLKEAASKATGAAVATGKAYLAASKAVEKVRQIVGDGKPRETFDVVTQVERHSLKASKAHSSLVQAFDFMTGQVPIAEDLIDERQKSIDVYLHMQKAAGKEQLTNFGTLEVPFENMPPAFDMNLKQQEDRRISASFSWTRRQGFNPKP